MRTNKPELSAMTGMLELLDKMTIDELEAFFESMDKEAGLIEQSLSNAVQMPRFPQELRTALIEKRRNQDIEKL